MSVMRTIPNIGPLFEPLEDAIRLQLIPSFTGHSPSCTIERELLSLPYRLGGLGIINPTTIADSQFNASTKITSLHKDLIVQQSVMAKLPDVSSIKNQIDDWPIKKLLKISVVALHLLFNKPWI